MKGRNLFADRRGQFLVQFVVIFPLLLLMIGVVLDGGLMYWQYRRAHIAVNAAAQTASHCVDIEHFRDTNEVILDQAQAARIAREYLDLNGGGRVQLVSIEATPYFIRVSGRATISTIFLRLAGINGFSVQVHGLAYPAFGIRTEGE